MNDPHAPSGSAPLSAVLLHKKQRIRAIVLALEDPVTPLQIELLHMAVLRIIKILHLIVLLWWLHGTAILDLHCCHQLISLG